MRTRVTYSPHNLGKQPVVGFVAQEREEAAADETSTHAVTDHCLNNYSASLFRKASKQQIHPRLDERHDKINNECDDPKTIKILIPISCNGESGPVKRRKTCSTNKKIEEVVAGEKNVFLDRKYRKEHPHVSRIEKTYETEKHHERNNLVT